MLVCLTVEFAYSVSYNSLTDYSITTKFGVWGINYSEPDQKQRLQMNFGINSSQYKMIYYT